jgi:hypothetical protein
MDEDELIPLIYHVKAQANLSPDGRRIYSESLLRSAGIDFEEARRLAEAHGGGLVPPPDSRTQLRAGQMVDRVDEQLERELDIPDHLTGGAIP